MEDLFLNIKEHKFLKRFKKSLENRFKVEIFLPVVKESSLTDVIFGSVHGSKTNIGHVKEFMSRKINRSSKTNELKQPSGITLVTLSDSEEESVASSLSEEDSISTDDSGSQSSIRSSNDVGTDCSTFLEDPVCIIGSTKNSPKEKTEGSPAVSLVLPNDSACFTECSSNSKAIENKYTGDVCKPCTASLEETVYIMGSIKNSPKPETEGSLDVSIASLNDSVCFIGCSSNSQPVVNKSCCNRDLGKLCSTNLEDNACIIGSTKDSAQTESLSNSIISLNDSVCFIECLPDSKPTTNNSLHAKKLGKPCSTSLEDSVCIIENAANTGKSKPDSPAFSIISPNDPVCFSECSSNSKPPITNKSWYTRDSWYTRQQKRMLKAQRRKEIRANKSQGQVKLSGSGIAEICKVTSTTEEPEVTGSRICTETQGSIKVLLSNNHEPAAEFISILNNKRRIEHTPEPRSKRKKENIPVSSAESQDVDDIIVLEPITEAPAAAPRRLRPIVIDGSNVARTHGKVNNTFSSKGIQLCVEYFLARGHTSVTAFVPNFRRHGERKAYCPTTDPTIMEELAKKQHVVFTPSRFLNGQCIASYDDRFVVQLASQNGGVIVSNDNFKDLRDESDSFKDAIEKRLLMFCFVGDVFMIPEDPLGRNGPKLADYLMFPAEEPSASE